MGRSEGTGAGWGRFTEFGRAVVGCDSSEEVMAGTFTLLASMPPFDNSRRLLW